MKLCPDRRRSSRQDDDFTTERLRSRTRLAGPGDLRGCRFSWYRSRQGYCLCGSGSVRVQSQWRLYYLHDWLARTVLQSWSHYQRGGGDRSSKSFLPGEEEEEEEEEEEGEGGRTSRESPGYATGTRGVISPSCPCFKLFPQGLCVYAVCESLSLFLCVCVCVCAGRRCEDSLQAYAVTRWLLSCGIHSQGKHALAGYFVDVWSSLVHPVKSSLHPRRKPGNKCSKKKSNKCATA